jgi:hypothetical protein
MLARPSISTLARWVPRAREAGILGLRVATRGVLDARFEGTLRGAPSDAEKSSLPRLIGAWRSSRGLAGSWSRRPQPKHAEAYDRKERPFPAGKLGDAPAGRPSAARSRSLPQGRASRVSRLPRAPSPPSGYAPDLQDADERTAEARARRAESDLAYYSSAFGLPA